AIVPPYDLFPARSMRHCSCDCVCSAGRPVAGGIADIRTGPQSRRRFKGDGMSIPDTFRAFRIHSDDAGYRSGIEQVRIDQLAPGEVVLKTAFSSVNFKDALAGTGKGRILRRFPL